MEDKFIDKIVAEVHEAAVGRRVGRIIPLGRDRLAIDLRSGDGRFLFISCEPSSPRLYLIERRLRDLEKAAANPTPFVQLIRSRLIGAAVRTVERLPNERVVMFQLDAADELGRSSSFSLVAQLTGRSANILLLDENGLIIESMRETRGRGQQKGDRYAPPTRPASPSPHDLERPQLDLPAGTSVSAYLDEAYLERAENERLRSLAAAAHASVNAEIKKRRRLMDRLNADLAAHGDAEKWKHLGDVLLANAFNIERRNGAFLAVDHFDENAPTIEIEADDNDTPTQTAEKYFRRYAKARNARVEISRRLDELAEELLKLEEKAELVRQAEADGDDILLRELGPRANDTEPATRRKKKRGGENAGGYRTFISSDGFEVLVGKRSTDNDMLTFRVARSGDTWLHAADYPGSHVVIRNAAKKEIPSRTLIEAAEIAAFYSDARQQPKAAVNYTLRKFVNKPRGSGPGLVSLSKFKTVLVQPKVSIDKKE